MGLRLSGFLAFLHLLSSAAAWAEPGEVVIVPPGKNPPLLIGYGMQMLDKAMGELGKMAAEIQFDFRNAGFMRVGSHDSNTPNQPIVVVSRDEKVIEAFWIGQGFISPAVTSNPPIQLQLSQEKIHDCPSKGGGTDGYLLRAENVPYPQDRFKPIAQTILIRMCPGGPVHRDLLMPIDVSMKIIKGTGWGTQASIVYRFTKDNIVDNTVYALQVFFNRMISDGPGQFEQTSGGAAPR